MAVKKTRNNGTMSEAAFWSMIRSTLRKRTMYWKPISEARKKARRPYKGKNKRQKWEFQCNICKDWFKSTQVAIDHIVPAGSLKCAEDLPNFVETLFCEIDNLQCVCKNCHDKKTKNDKKRNRKTV